jgi:hypothetical protein
VPPGTDIIGVTLKQDDMPAGVTAGRQVELVAYKGWKLSASAYADLDKVKQPPDWILPPDPMTWKATVVAVDGTKITVAVAAADAVMVQQEAHTAGSLGLILLPAGS